MENTNDYFRITGYDPDNDRCFILDCNGRFEQLWQFSSLLVCGGLKVLEVSASDKFLDGNIPPAPHDAEQLFLRADASGRPAYKTVSVAGKQYRAVSVPDRNKHD